MFYNMLHIWAQYESYNTQVYITLIKGPSSYGFGGQLVDEQKQFWPYRRKGPLSRQNKLYFTVSKTDK